MTERIFAWTPMPLGELSTGVLLLVDRGIITAGCLRLQRAPRRVPQAVFVSHARA
jgi:hypothetical protein